MTEKWTRTIGTFMKAQRESENNCTKFTKQAIGTNQAASLLEHLPKISSLACVLTGALAAGV